MRRKVLFIAITATLVVGGFFLVTVLRRSQRTLHVLICRDHMRQIASACNAYALDNDGEYPPSLQALYPTYVWYAPVFGCPANPSSWQDFERGTVTAASSSYVYRPGRWQQLKGDIGTDCYLYERTDSANHPIAHLSLFILTGGREEETDPYLAACMERDSKLIEKKLGELRQKRGTVPKSDAPSTSPPPPEPNP